MEILWSDEVMVVAFLRNYQRAGEQFMGVD